MDNNKKPSRKHDWTPQELQLIALCIQQGWIDASGLKNLEYLYQSYHALGGNGTGTELYNRAKALPIRD